MRNEDKEAIRSANPIEEVIGERVDLKKVGAKYRGVCPFHDDVDPSLVVNPARGLYNCFGCPKGEGSGGDVFAFVMRYHGVDFASAAEMLQARAGMASRNGNGARKEGKRSGAAPLREALREVSVERRKKLLGRVREVCHREYLEEDAGRNYLENERRVPGSLAAKHRIGFTAGDVLERIVPPGEVLEELRALGVVNARGKERFQGRVIFPLLDADGEVVGLIGRSVNGTEPRYMALPEPFLGIFNRTCLGTSDWVVLVEGVFDALAVEAIGYPNVVPLCGKIVREELEGALRAASVRQVVLMLDAGEEEAADSLAGRLRERIEGVDVRVVSLPELDPSALVATGRGDLVRSAIESARSADSSPSPAPAEMLAEAAPARPGEVVLELVCETRRYVVEAIENRGPTNLRVSMKAFDGPRFHLHTFNLKDSKARKLFEKDVALLYRVNPVVVSADMQRVIERVQAYVLARIEKAGARQVVETPEDIAGEAKALGRSGDILGRVVEDAAKLGVVGEEANLLAMYFLVTSRKMDDPLSILFLSGSGSGKSLVQDKLLSLCPPEDLILVTALTGRSLFYKETSLKGKVLAIREETGAESAGYAIRALISDKELVVEATIKDPVTGRMTTMTNRVEGPPAVSLTSASKKTDPETLSRFLVRSIDESAEQTLKILEQQREGETLEGLFMKKERERVVEVHRAFQRMLVPRNVVNPFAKWLTYPVRSLRARRSHPMYLALIRTVAFLNQMKKPVRRAERFGQVIEYIEVDLDDVRAAHRLAHALLGGTLEDLSDVGRSMLDEIGEMVDKRESAQEVPREEIFFSRREVREWTGRGDFQVRTYLEELVELEYVVPVSAGQGRRTLYRLEYRGEGDRRDRFALGLVELDELEKGARELGLVREE